MYGQTAEHPGGTARIRVREVSMELLCFLNNSTASTKLSEAWL